MKQSFLTPRLKTYRNLFFIAVFFLFSKNSFSQWYVYGGPGFAFYQGDISETFIPSLRLIKFNGKVGVGYYLNNRWSLRLHGSYGNLHGSDGYSSDIAKNARGISFTTTVIDAGLTARYDNFFKRSNTINYAFFGFDYMNMAVNKSLAVTGTAVGIAENSFSSTQFNVPIGFGLGKWFSKHWGVIYEFSYHYALTDYLDGTSAAGNSKSNDSFIANHLFLIYRFGNKLYGGSGGSGGSGGGGDLKVDCPTF